MAHYVLISLSPLVMLGMGAVFGGPWPALALVWVTLGAALIDVLPHHANAAPLSDAQARRLSSALAVVQGLFLAAMVYVLGRAEPFRWLDHGLLFAASGLYLGQVAMSNAHDLIHASTRLQRRLGEALFRMMLFGHHSSAHRLVHHVHVASAGDPNSARRGAGFYRFWLRAWFGSFRAGFHAENRLRQRKSPPPGWWTHPYLGHVTGAALSLAGAAALAGPRGVLALSALCVLAQAQLLLADYVQHYGLRRATLDDGRLEPVSPRHSWNAQSWYTGAVMLNAPRHSDHHQNPGRQFSQLRIDPDTMPILPASLPSMALIALVPPLWRHIMDPRVRSLTEQA